MEPPEDYFSLHFFVLRLSGLGLFPPFRANNNAYPEDESNFSRKYLITHVFPVAIGVMILSPILEISAAYYVDFDAESLLSFLLFSPYQLITLIKLSRYYTHGRKIRCLVFNLEVATKQFYQNYDLILATKKMTQFIMMFFYVLVVGLTLFGFTSSFQNVDVDYGNVTRHGNVNSVEPIDVFNRKLRLPFLMAIPFHIDNAGVFCLVAAYQVIVVLWWGLLIGSADMLVFTCIIHLETQFRILQEALETIVMRTCNDVLNRKNEGHEKLKFNDSNEGSCVQQLLVSGGITKIDLELELNARLHECIRHHQHILRCAVELEGFYGLGFFVQFAGSLFSICMSLSAMTVFDGLNWSMIQPGLYFMAMITQLGTVCWAGTEVTYQAEAVSISIQKISWFHGDRSFRKDLQFMLMRAQYPVILTAGNFVTLSLNSFLATLRAAYSYYTVLHQTQ